MFIKNLVLLLSFLYITTGTDGLLCPLRDDLTYFCKIGEVCCGQPDPRCCSTLTNIARTKVLTIKGLPISFLKEPNYFGGTNSSYNKLLPILPKIDTKPFTLKGIDSDNFVPREPENPRMNGGLAAKLVKLFLAAVAAMFSIAIRLCVCSSCSNGSDKNTQQEPIMVAEGNERREPLMANTLAAIPLPYSPLNSPLNRPIYNV
uniref:Uncharacterized protein n=1 Tax=Homalodisca liturata TaxID=320908 RepID=A0A1B6IL31_9HEMI